MDLKGRIAGTIPYDFEPPSLRKEFRTWWNPSSDEILVPRAFGIGWAFNLAALKRRYPVVFWAVVGLAAIVVVAQWRSARDS
jgi:uncharacterized membrane protein